MCPLLIQEGKNFLELRFPQNVENDYAAVFASGQWQSRFLGEAIGAPAFPHFTGRYIQVHRIIMCCVVGAILALSWMDIEARPHRVDQIPNGQVNSCATCHVGSSGGVRNPFGQAVESGFLEGGNVVWNATLAGSDSDGDGASNGLELQDPTGAWRPGQANPGTASLVTNPGNASSVPQQQANQPPVFTNVPAQTVDEGQLLTFQVQATDPEEDTVTIAASNLPAGATFANGTFSWTPGSDQAGDYTVVFTASDGKGGEATLNVSIAVNDVPRPLVISSFLPNQSALIVAWGVTLRLSVVAESPDRGALTYAWTVNAQAQAETGASLLWTSSAGSADDEISVVVSDGVESRTQSWTVSKALKGDLNGDGTVGFPDFLLFVASFGKTPGDPAYNPAADLTGDNTVGFADFLVFASFFGRSI